jgi:tRNA(fMet)-specific endonuclease VapC
MTPLYMLDTNMLSYIAHGRSKAARARLLEGRNEADVCVSAITQAEVRYGLAKRPEATMLRTLLEDLLRRIDVAPFDDSAALRYGTMRAKQEAVGKTLGPLDMLIAAHAVALRAVLVTNGNVFRNVPDLAGIENWATDL